MTDDDDEDVRLVSLCCGNMYVDSDTLRRHNNNVLETIDFLHRATMLNMKKNNVTIETVEAYSKEHNLDTFYVKMLLLQ
jgi:hypothetical protein